MERNPFMPVTGSVETMNTFLSKFLSKNEAKTSSRKRATTGICHSQLKRYYSERLKAWFLSNGRGNLPCNLKQILGTHMLTEKRRRAGERNRPHTSSREIIKKWHCGFWLVRIVGKHAVSESSPPLQSCNLRTERWEREDEDHFSSDLPLQQFSFLASKISASFCCGAPISEAHYPSMFASFLTIYYYGLQSCSAVNAPRCTSGLLFHW